jgi:hypothetical protein
VAALLLFPARSLSKVLKSSGAQPGPGDIEMQYLQGNRKRGGKDNTGSSQDERERRGFL